LASIVSTDAGAAVAPIFELYRNSASPAVSDRLGSLNFTGNLVSGGAKVTYASIDADISASPGSNQPKSMLRFNTYVNGSQVTLAQLDNQTGFDLGTKGLRAGYFIVGSDSPYAGNNVINGGLTINNFGSADNLELVDTVPSNVNSDPRLSFYRDSDSPADNDHAGRIEFYANNDADQKTNTAGILHRILDVTDGTEDGELTFGVMQAGTFNTLLTLDPNGVTVDGELTVNADTLKLTSTVASSTTENPSIELFRNGGAAAAGAELGAIKFFGTNNASTPEKIEYAGIYAETEYHADGNEQGNIKFKLSHGGAQEDPVMSLFSYGMQMGYGNPILMSYSNGYQQFFSENAVQKSFKFQAFPNATVANGAYNIYLPDVAGGTLAVIDSDKAFTAGATTVNGALTVNSDLFEITSTVDDATEKPIISLYRDAGVPSANDELGAIRWFGQNASDEKQFYGGIYVQADAVTDGAHKGSLNFHLADGSNNGTAISDVLVDINGDEDPTMSLTSELLSVKANVLIQASASDGQGVQATPTPILELYQEDGPSSDDGDHLGEIQFTAYNDNGYSPAKHKYAGIHAEIIDESNATEDGSLHFTCIKAGTEDNTVLTLNGSGSTLFSDLIAPLTISSNTTDADLIITNSLDSADASPIIKLHREAGPNGHADGDDVGKLEFHGTNDRGLSSGGPENVLYGSMFTEVVDSSDGTEDGQIKFTAIKAGSATDVLTLNGSGSTLTGSLEVTGGVTASQTIVNAVTDTDISVSEFATYNGKKIIYTGGAGSVHLADAVAADIGKAWTIINAGTGAITVNRATSTQTIKLLNGSAVSAGSANLTLATGGIIEIICTAADNYIAFGSGIS
jgi:hypothetical protein